MSPLETQVREHHLQLRRRLDSIKRIHGASDELEDRIAELEQQDEALAADIAALDRELAEIAIVDLRRRAAAARRERLTRRRRVSGRPSRRRRLLRAISAAYFRCSASFDSTWSGLTGMQSTGQTSTHCGVSKWPTHSVHLSGSIT